MNWEVEQFRITIFMDTDSVKVSAIDFWNQVMERPPEATSNFSPADDHIQVAELQFAGGLVQVRSQASQDRLDCVVGAVPSITPQLSPTSPFLGNAPEYEQTFLAITERALSSNASLIRVATSAEGREGRASEMIRLIKTGRSRHPR